MSTSQNPEPAVTPRARPGTSENTWSRLECGDATINWALVDGVTMYSTRDVTAYAVAKNRTNTPRAKVWAPRPFEPLLPTLFFLGMAAWTPKSSSATLQNTFKKPAADHCHSGCYSY